MSVGLKLPEALLAVNGVRLASKSANLYAKARADLTLIELCDGTVSSAVFTKNLFCAAPVSIAKNNIQSFKPRFLLINAANANAGTGEQGIQDANECCQALSELTECKTGEILPFSTGVIGEYLPVDKIKRVLPDLVNNLSESSWLNAAEAIMTTDTLPKAVSRQININGETITITGMTKGAGMIKPNMATMLAFIGTDAKISQEILDNILLNAIDKSFNRITVDGDTSTNDACIIFATGKANNNLITASNCDDFESEITKVCCQLAQSIVRDGEGASKFISIQVKGGKASGECLDVAYKIAESPLVKTAFTASDPNWGRILAAVGNSGIDDLDINKVKVYLGDVCIVENGQRAETYTEESGKSIMNQDEITVSISLDRGDYNEEIWTTDLSHEYVTINAEYRT